MISLKRLESPFAVHFSVPGDKSISHRALMLTALCEGKCHLTNVLQSEDVDSTKACLQTLGVEIVSNGADCVVFGVGLAGLKAPVNTLDCGNSGTTIRLLSGILAGQGFSSILIGDSSLALRPMQRIADPLREMGAEVELLKEDYLPISIKGKRPLVRVNYNLRLASAQVKSCILLAGLFSSDGVRISGRIESRDHTERLIRALGREIIEREDCLELPGGGALISRNLDIPGDLSSASFWMAAVALVPGSEVVLENCSLNPTRMGFLNLLKSQGLKIQIESVIEEWEPRGRLRICSDPDFVLSSFHIDERDIPPIIDEIPLVALLATQADGLSIISGAAELRKKESDRLSVVAKHLNAMGAQVEETSDGLRVQGRTKLVGTRIDPMGDHRIAMTFSIASLIAKGETQIIHPEVCRISYPGFFEHLSALEIPMGL